MRILLAFVLFVFHFFAIAQTEVSYLYDPNAYARERWVDFEHAMINLEFEPEQGKVNGRVEHTFTPLRNSVDSVFLDAINTNIKTVMFNNDSLNYRLTDKGVKLLFSEALERGQSYKVVIEYSCQPKRGLYFIGWDDATGRCRKQIWTQGQGIDNRHWVPLFDDLIDKIKTDILIKMDTSFKVLSNGHLVNRFYDNSGKATWHYQMDKPHSPYLMMLGIGDYKINSTTSKSGVPLNRYYYPEWENRFTSTYRFDKEIFDFLESEIGLAYPWGSYSQVPVQDFPYGAMENTSATIFGDFFCVDSNSFNDANYVYVNGHELAHQWFGDWVTAISSKHHWLHESFATYYHHLVVKEFLGENEFLKMMRDNQNAALSGTEKDMKGVGHSQAGSHRHYLKGSYVLKMLRYVVGDEDYRTAIQYYLNKHQLQNVSTDDLIAAFAESTGHSIGPFINQWVYQGGEPKYQVSFQTLKKQKQHRFVVNQLQDSSALMPTFKMPIVFEVYYSDGSKDSIRQWINSRSDTVNIPFESKKKISFVLFDPNSEILKSVEFKKPVDWSLNQALMAKSMIDRYDALVDLRSVEMAKKERTLHKILAKTEFYMVRGEALKQLIKEDVATNSEVSEILKGSDVSLQKILLNSVKTLVPEVQTDYELMLQAPSYDLQALALMRLCKAYPNEAKNYLDQLQNTYGTKGNNVRINWLAIDWQLNNNQSSKNELIDMTSNSYEFITRQKAIGVIKQLNLCNEQLIRNLCFGVQKSNWKLAGACGNTIKYFYKKPEFKEMVKRVSLEVKLNDQQRKKVERYLVD